MKKSKVHEIETEKHPKNKRFNRIFLAIKLSSKVQRRRQIFHNLIQVNHYASFLEKYFSLFN